MNTDYAELSQLVRNQGLFDRQYAYYATKIAVTFSLLALSIFVIRTVDNFLIQIVNALFLAFVFVQLGMLLHDADHPPNFQVKALQRLSWSVHR